MIAMTVDRWNRIRVQRRKDLDAGQSLKKLLMLSNRPLALGAVAGEENGDRVEIRAGKTSNPIVGMVFADVADHLIAGDHPLPEFLWKGGERILAHAQCAQPVIGESHGYPAAFSFGGSLRFLG